MFFQFGHTPGLRALSALIITFAAMQSYADSRVPLTLAEAEDIALASEPGQQALMARAAAFAEQSVASGQLPDPQLRVGLLNYPINSGNFTTEGMTQAQLGYRQEFPKGKSRSLASAQLLAMSDGQLRSADARSRDVLGATRSSWLEAFYWHRAKQVLDELRPFFKDLVSITESMYAVGRKTQYDVLRAELELRRLDDRLIEADRSLSAAQASLSQWLGDDAYRSPTTNLPKWDQLPLLATLKQEIHSHPILLAADAEVTARQAGVDLAEESKKPGWALDLGYGYRDGYLSNGEPRSDFVSLAVTVDLPFFRKNRQDRKLAVALSERSAARSSRDRLTAEVRSQLALQYSHWEDLGRRIELYETQILDLSAGQAEAAMLAYQSDTGTFSDTMQGYIDDLDIRLEHIHLKVERAQAYAMLANLGGFPR